MDLHLSDGFDFIVVKHCLHLSPIAPEAPADTQVTTALLYLYRSSRSSTASTVRWAQVSHTGANASTRHAAATGGGGARRRRPWRGRHGRGTGYEEEKRRGIFPPITYVRGPRWLTALMLEPTAMTHKG
jgi:hypothetical protein